MNEEELKKYMKEKAEDITVPSNLSPDAIEDKLAKIPQKKTQPFRVRSGLVAAAACLFLLLIGGITAGQYLTNDLPPDAPIVPEKVTTNTTDDSSDEIVGYENAYDSIQEYYNQQKQSYRRYAENELSPQEEGEEVDMAEDSMGADASESKSAPAVQKDKEQNSSASSSSDFSDTDVQVDGVMEGDIVKTDGNYIYTIQNSSTGSCITVYSVDGKDVEKVSDIDVEHRSVNEMYLAKDRLILINSLWNEYEYETWDEYDDVAEMASYRGSDKTEITIYDVSNHNHPVKMLTQTQSGNYNTSRVSDGYLYTFTTYRIGVNNLKKDKPETYIPLINDKCIDSKDVRCISKDVDYQYMVMTSLLLDGTSEFSDAICSLGGAQVYYVSNENIYCTKTSVRQNYEDENDIFTNISKYSYDKGSFRFIAKQMVRGIIKDSYYLHEYKGNLCYVYTRYLSSGTTTNGIVTLDDKLNKLGELNHLGRDERIYSSYYINHMAYFVTYRETDPVFAVDLSDPKEPKLLSELKIPGFSSYLHSFGEGLLLGIGEEEADENEDWDFCTKLSIFSIKDNTDVQEISKKLLRLKGADFESAYTYAANNHKAVFVDEERKIIGFGIRYDTYDKTGNRYEVYSYANNKLQRILSKDILSLNDVRGLRIGEYFYVVEADTGITVYNMPASGQTKPMTKVN